MLSVAWCHVGRPDVRMMDCRGAVWRPGDAIIKGWQHTSYGVGTPHHTGGIGLVVGESSNLESVSTNAIYIIPVSMTLQRAATVQA